MGGEGKKFHTKQQQLLPLIKMMFTNFLFKPVDIKSQVFFLFNKSNKRIINSKLQLSNLRLFNAKQKKIMPDSNYKVISHLLYYFEAAITWLYLFQLFRQQWQIEGFHKSPRALMSATLTYLP